jgi:hypothetical protein
MLNRSLAPFQFAVSFSSFEHDGLGRYGDLVHPFSDIRAMQRVRCSLAAGSLLFLAVPLTQQDVLVWNAHRIYGIARLPMLTAGFQVGSSCCLLLLLLLPCGCVPHSSLKPSSTGARAWSKEQACGSHSWQLWRKTRMGSRWPSTLCWCCVGLAVRASHVLWFERSDDRWSAA